MIDLTKYNCGEIPKEYREKFFASMFTKGCSEIQPFLWQETDECFELFIADNKLFLTKEVIDFFSRLQGSNPKTITCFSNKPIHIDNELYQNTSDWYVKLSYFKNDKFEFNGNTTSNRIKLVDPIDDELQISLLKLFVSDHRLSQGDVRMNGVYENVLEEFEADRKQCDWGCCLLDDEPVGFVSGMRMSDDIYAHPFYLIAMIWVSSKVDSGIKKELIRKIISWLNERGGLYSAGINFHNNASRLVAERNGFRPYFARFLQWPKK